MIAWYERRAACGCTAYPTNAAALAALGACVARASPTSARDDVLNGATDELRCRFVNRKVVTDRAFRLSAAAAATSAAIKTGFLATGWRQRHVFVDNLLDIVDMIVSNVFVPDRPSRRTSAS